MANCGPKDIYTALIKAGFSTIQAVGVMANGIAESGLSPEVNVVDSNGYRSYGIWQFNAKSYPNAASLVTGNCEADITAQVGLVKASASGQALNGSNAGEVAGNFAQYFERCATCQPGGDSYNARVANAATVAGWVSSGRWPTSSAGLSGSASSAAAAASGPDCAFGPNLPLVGTVCLVKKTTIRHLVGGGLMVAGGAVGGLGVILLAAFAFRASGAARTLSNLPGPVRSAGRSMAADTGPAQPRAPRQPREPSAQSQQRRLARGRRAEQERRSVHHEPRRTRRRPDLGELTEVEPGEHE